MLFSQLFFVTLYQNTKNKKYEATWGIFRVGARADDNESGSRDKGLQDICYMIFNLTSQYAPTGDQPEAIAQLTQGVRDG